MRLFHMLGSSSARIPNRAWTQGAKPAKPRRYGTACRAAARAVGYGAITPSSPPPPPPPFLTNDDSSQVKSSKNDNKSSNDDSSMFAFVNMYAFDSEVNGGAVMWAEMVDGDSGRGKKAGAAPVPTQVLLLLPGSASFQRRRR